MKITTKQFYDGMKAAAQNFSHMRMDEALLAALKVWGIEVSNDEPERIDTEAKFKEAMRLRDFRQKKREAKIMARAWRDLYNEIGAVPEVERAWERVERAVQENE